MTKTRYIRYGEVKDKSGVIRPDFWSRQYYNIIPDKTNPDQIMILGSVRGHIALQKNETFRYQNGKVAIANCANQVRRAIYENGFAPETLLYQNNPVDFIRIFPLSVCQEYLLSYKSIQLNRSRPIKFELIDENRLKNNQYLRRDIYHHGIIICLKRDKYSDYKYDLSRVVVNSHLDNLETADWVGKILSQLKTYSFDSRTLMQRFEDAIEKSTGEKIEDIRRIPIDQRRKMIEQKYGQPMTVEQSLPRETVLHDRVEAELDQILCGSRKKIY